MPNLMKTSCPCIEPLQTREHLMQTCPPLWRDISSKTRRAGFLRHSQENGHTIPRLPSLNFPIPGCWGFIWFIWFLREHSDPFAVYSGKHPDLFLLTTLFISSLYQDRPRRFSDKPWECPANSPFKKTNTWWLSSPWISAMPNLRVA